MRWEDERYVRLYTRDTVDWHFLSFEAQGLLSLILRKVDRAGLLPLGKHGVRGLAAVLGHPSRTDAIGSALDELIADGCVQLRGDHLVVPNFIEAQETPSSDTQRKRDQRERDRAVALAAELGLVTKRDIESRNVTDGHETGQKVTRGHAASRAVTPNRAVPSVPSLPSLPSEPTKQVMSSPGVVLPVGGLGDQVEAIWREEKNGSALDWGNNRPAEERALFALETKHGRPRLLEQWRRAIRAPFPKCWRPTQLAANWAAFDTGTEERDWKKGRVGAEEINPQAFEVTGDITDGF